MHPRMGRIPPTPDEPLPTLPGLAQDRTRGRLLNDIEEDEVYFGGRRDQSPSSISVSSRENKAPESLASSQDYLQPQPSPSSASSYGQSPEKATRQNPPDSAGLAPPRLALPRRTSNVMSSPAPLGSPEEEGASATSSAFHSQPSRPPRKLSGGSVIVSPTLGSLPHRSSSIGSDMSAPLPRPSFNYSRPLSRAGTPTLDLLARQASSDSQASFILADETAHTPISMTGEFPDGLADDGRAGAPSYLYSKFSLPRGKMLQRNSATFADGQPQTSFHWDQPMTSPSNVQTIPYGGHAPPSPPTRPSSSAGASRPGPRRSEASSATRCLPRKPARRLSSRRRTPAGRLPMGAADRPRMRLGAAP